MHGLTGCCQCTAARLLRNADNLGEKLTMQNEQNIAMLLTMKIYGIITIRIGFLLTPILHMPIVHTNPQVIFW